MFSPLWNVTPRTLVQHRWVWFFRLWLNREKTIFSDLLGEPRPDSWSQSAFEYQGSTKTAARTPPAWSRPPRMEIGMAGMYRGA